MTVPLDVARTAALRSLAAPARRLARLTGLWLALLLTLVVASGCQGSARLVTMATAAPTPTASPHYTPIPTDTPTPGPSATPAVAMPDYAHTPVAALDPAALGAQLAMVETKVRDPSVTGDHLVWMGHLQQLVYSRLADWPQWQDQVLAAVPEKARPSVLHSLDAGKQLRSMHAPIPKELPDWKILSPQPPDDLLKDYREGEAQYGVPWYYLAAIHLVESRMGRIHGLSTAGAQGPMQFIPSTWASYGKGDINNDHDAILAAARYLKAAGAPGDMTKALYAYNHSEGYVNAIADYAEAMRADPAAFRGYYGWQVYYATEDGPVLLPVGWTKLTAP